MSDKLQELEERIAKLEKDAFYAKMRASENDVFAFVKLDESWADQQIRFDPRGWEGESMVGKTMSQCSPEYLLKLADVNQYTAMKQAQEPNPKLDAKGKPFYERNKFTAKLARTWAHFKKSESDPAW